MSRILAGFTSLSRGQFRAGVATDHARAFFSGDDVSPAWLSTLSAAGVHVTPELAMTLSAFYGGVATIAYDLATLPLQVFRYRDDGGKDRVRAARGAPGNGGINSLAYMLRWQPNEWQTATEFFVGQIAQLLLRDRAYAEIVPGPTGFLGQLLPRHPDRVRPERLPSGRVRYRLTEADGSTRYLTQDEMHVVRGLSLGGGLDDGMSLTRYGANAIGTALAAEAAAGKFFRSGMTAAKIATYEGEMSEDDERQLHASISRYAAGVENSFGLALVPDKVTITNLGIEPDKAQMMAAREWGVREVARYLRLPGHKLGIRDSVAYSSQVQAAIDYVIGCLRPIAVIIEQAIQRDLILAKDTYFAEFNLDALLRGDPESQAKVMAALIEARVMRPSEARLKLNMNPDPRLDELSERDHRPADPRGARTSEPARESSENSRRRSSPRAMYDYHRMKFDAARRCVRRERVAVEKLARKHANDPDGWVRALQDFASEHARFISETMHVSPEIARAYAAQHGTVFATRGVVVIDGKAGDEWERHEADELAALSLEGMAA